MLDFVVVRGAPWTLASKPFATSIVSSSLEAFILATKMSDRN